MNELIVTVSDFHLVNLVEILSILSISISAKKQNDFAIDKLISRIREVFSVLAEIHSVEAAIDFVFSGKGFVAAEIVGENYLDVSAGDI